MRLLQNSPRRRLERRALLGKSWKSRLFAPSNARRSGFAEVSNDETTMTNEGRSSNGEIANGVAARSLFVIVNSFVIRI
jgi:hypothetical protein